MRTRSLLHGGVPHVRRDELRIDAEGALAEETLLCVWIDGGGVVLAFAAELSFLRLDLVGAKLSAVEENGAVGLLDAVVADPEIGREGCRGSEGRNKGEGGPGAYVEEVPVGAQGAIAGGGGCGNEKVDDTGPGDG